jgi:hypothetical protein
VIISRLIPGNPGTCQESNAQYVPLQIYSTLLASHRTNATNYQTNKKQTPWSESVSELYRLSDRRLSAKLVPTFADRGCHVVSVTDHYGRILDFLTGAATFLSSSSSVVLTRLSGPVPDPLLLRKSGSAGNRTLITFLSLKCAQGYYINKTH